MQDLHYVVHVLLIDSFLAPRGNFFTREPLDQLEISTLTECELKRFSGAFRAGAPSPLACLPLARPFSLSFTTSTRLLRRLTPAVHAKTRGALRVQQFAC